MSSVEQLLDLATDSAIESISYPCEGVGVIELGHPLALADFGISLGLEPVAHDGRGSVLWDVHAVSAGGTGAPRSHTSEEFTWHTDASFESPPPRYFMLQVLHGDKMGGGLQRLLPLASILCRLETEVQSNLAALQFPWAVPKEFDKGQVAPRMPVLFNADYSPSLAIRYRKDCLVGGECTTEMRLAMQGLQRAIATSPVVTHDPQETQIIMVDNYHVLHARDEIKDARRHLQRVRFG